MYKLSVKAVRDVELLYDYSAAQFGDEQAERYLLELEKAFLLLAEFPYMGKAMDSLRPSLRCYYHRSHAIFYKPNKTGVFIVRVLDQRMNAPKHLQ